jgi:cytochrome d ubiquinol oxidase subunit I
MNWSDYSRFVGDIFGAPLAIEGLLAFFLESTFLGLWIFGWDRLSKRMHLATIWIAASGTLISAYFILAANSFMQNPVGYTYNEVSGRAELTDFTAVLTNKVALVTFPHTIAGAFITGGGLVLGIALWNLIRHSDRDAGAFRTAAKAGAATVVVAAALLAVTGDRQAKVMTEVQPMKMAAAEAQYDTKDGASFSIFSIGTPDGSEETFSIRIPKMLSFFATGDFNGRVEGINDLQSAYEAKYGPGDYSPNTAVTYWTFRFMIGIGMFGALIAVWAWWRIRKGKGFSGRMAWWAAVTVPFMGLLGNSFGWIFTEMGRQPWIVFGLMPTSAGVSPGVSATEVWISMIGFTLVYGALAVVEVKLLLKYIAAGLPTIPSEPTDSDDSSDEERPLAFAY